MTDSGVVGTLRALLELTKPRITALVLVTVAAAAWLAAPAGGPGWILVHVLLGTWLVAGGTNALNQIVEADVDARMVRTRRRPLPTGRLARGPAFVFAWSMGVLGVGYLFVTTNGVAAALAAITLVSYVFLYTPLKRRTPLATLVGAIPGALPVVGGWAAVRGGVPGLEAWILFAILFLWQIPHFLALAWLYREDYAAAGLQMLSVEDESGRATFRQAALAAIALISVAVSPTLVGLAGPVYFWGALVLTLWFAFAASRAARGPSILQARKLFRVSIAYLPALLFLMMMDRVP